MARSNTGMGLSDADREAIRDMSRAASNGRRVDSVAEAHAFERDSGEWWRGACRVTEALCERLRARSANGESYTAIAGDVGLAPRNVRYHVTGDCVHEYNCVDPARCAVARQRARDGHDMVAIGEFIGAERNTVWYHVRGKCTCDDHHNIRPVIEREVTPAGRGDCRTWRRAVRSGDTAAGVARRDDVTYSRATVSKHVYGRCSCEHDTPPVEK